MALAWGESSLEDERSVTRGEIDAEVTTRARGEGNTVVAQGVG